MGIKSKTNQNDWPLWVLNPRILKKYTVYWFFFQLEHRFRQRYTYRDMLQTIQVKLILLCVWAEPAVLGSAKTALKFKYEI